jgi:hypothetical protein
MDTISEGDWDDASYAANASHICPGPPDLCPLLHAGTFLCLQPPESISSPALKRGSVLSPSALSFILK